MQEFLIEIAIDESNSEQGLKAIINLHKWLALEVFEEVVHV